MNAPVVGRGVLYFHSRTAILRYNLLKSSIVSFTELGLHSNLLSRLEKLGYSLPAPAHAQLLPPMLEGEDVLVVCTIGSGCTEAAIFALLHRCLQSPDSHEACVILTPSDDHAVRTTERIKVLTGNAVSVNIFANSDLTTAPKSTVPLINISTPKHYLEQLRKSESVTAAPSALLLTETDEMIARGAKTPLLELGALLGLKPQVLICTGRETHSVTRVSNVLQHQPVRPIIKPDGEHPASIPQQVWPVPAHLKMNLLFQLQRRNHPASMVVITAEKETASRVARRLRAANSSAAALLKSDSTERQNSLRTRFEVGDIKILLLSGKIPTDLRMEIVTHVVNYDLPSDSRVYFSTLRRVPHAVHVNLVAPSEEERVLKIEDDLGRPLCRDILTDFDYTQPSPKHETTPRPEKTVRPSSSTRKKPRVKKTDWDPETPRSWGDRNAPRKDPEKIPLAEWSPDPLPDIWSKDKTSSKPSASKQVERRRPRRNRRGRGRRRQGYGKKK